MDSITEKLCQAIEIIAEKAVSSANYDRTIQATIVSCQDQSIGKYKVHYQDGYWYAYGDVENTYSKGDLVYILVPEGDMNRDKTILGSTKKIATNLTTVVNETDKFIPIGNNVLPEGSYQLCSYFNEPVPLHPIYIRGAEGDLGTYLTPTIDAEIKQYLSSATVVELGFTARTQLPPQQKLSGNYGLQVNLVFQDQSSGDLIKRQYILDIDNMQGNPYNLITQTFQHKYYDIDGANFQYVDSIYLFAQDFPEHYDTKPEDKPYDIFIKNLYFNSAEMMSEQDYNSNTLVLLTPKGYIFNNTDLASDTRRLQAQVRIKGKKVSENNPDLSFYWFRENSGINASSPKFNSYGKQGWECLNPHVANKTPYEYLKGQSHYDIRKDVCFTKETKFKCVAVYGDTLLSKEITILNNDANYIITLTTDSGKTEFPENTTESPIIICNVDPAEPPAGYHYVYDWCYYDTGLVYHTILKSNDTSNNITNLNTIKSFIDSNFTSTDTISYSSINYQFERAEITLLDNKTIDAVFADNGIIKSDNLTYGEFTEIPSSSSVAAAATTLGMAIYDRLHTDERSNGNEVYNVKIANIINYRIYKCSVFASNTIDDSQMLYIGTAALKIVNGVEEVDDINVTRNKLIVQNNTQVFKYNTAGVSPCAKSNKNPYKIPNLNLLIYDNDGHDITTQALRTSTIVWRVPIKNTLLNFSNTGYTLIPDTTNPNFAYIKNVSTLAYNISNKYYMNYSNNTIYVAVDYDDETLIGSTNLTFLKEGIPGTNGTDYSINIIFNNTNRRIPYPTIYYYDNDHITCNWKNSLPNNEENWFKVQLWHNGGEQPIFESAIDGNATDSDDPTNTNEGVTVRWRVLFRDYPDVPINHFLQCATLDDDNFSTVPKFRLDTTKISQYWGLVDAGNEQILRQKAPANLIQVKVTYKDFDYYDVLPILFSRVASGNTSYKIDLQEDTGFTEAMYDTNGVDPEYDNTNPFTVDISGGASVEGFSYQFIPVGSVRYYVTKQTTAAFTDINYLIPLGLINGLAENQKVFAPCKKYDGQATNIGIICQIKDNNNAIFGTLLIPVYFYLNRYSNSGLNGWDGNSVDLGQTNGGMILAPQVGAGYKEEDNSFTGVVIGTVQDPQQRLQNPTSAFSDRRRLDAGLFGYHAGARSIFLDAKTGKAEFGTGHAKIILDPSLDRALLFNEGYRQIRNNIAYDALDNPDSSYIGEEGTGLKIDLTKPEIRYGNGKFSVDQNGNIVSMSGHIGGWKITDHTLESDAQAVDENGRPLYDNDYNPVSAIYLDSLTHTIRGGTLISNNGEIGGWNISRHRLYSKRSNTYNQDNIYDQEIDEDGNLLYKDEEGNLLYKDEEDNFRYKDEEGNPVYEGEEDPIPFMKPIIYFDSQTETVYGGTIVGSVIKSKNYKQTEDDNGNIITEGTIIDLNGSEFHFANDYLYYDSRALWVKSLAGGATKKQVQEVWTATGGIDAKGNSYAIRTPEWCKDQMDNVERGYILINNPYLQINPDRPQEARWFEPYHHIINGQNFDADKYEGSNEQLYPNDITWDGGPHYGTLVYGEDAPRSGITARGGHVYRITWDIPYLRFYVDGQLVSTLGQGSYLSPYSEIFGNLKIEAMDALPPLRVNSIRTFTDNAIVNIKNPTGIRPSDSMSALKVGVIKTIRENVIPRNDLMIWAPYVNTALQTITDVIIDSSTKIYKNAGTIIIDTINPPDSMQIIDNEYPRYYCSFNNGTTWKGYSDLTSNWQDDYGMTSSEIEALTSTVWNSCQPFKIKIIMDDVSTLTQITAFGASRNTDNKISITFDEAYVGKNWTVTGGIESYSGRVTSTLAATVTLIAPTTTYTFICDHRTITYTTGSYGAAGVIPFDASVITINFMAEQEGETWTVTDGDTQTYTGTVGGTLTATARVQQLNTTYTITCGEEERTVRIGDIVKNETIVLGEVVFDITKSSYYSNTTNELICTLSGRSFTKVNAEDALVGYWFKSSGYTGPILVSNVSADAVAYSASGSRKNSMGSITFDNQTWYYSSDQYFMSGDLTSTNGTGAKIGSYNGPAEAAQALLRLAYVEQGASNEYLPYSDKIKIINESTVDNFDANSTNWDNVVLSNTTTLNNNNDAVKVGYPINAYGLLEVGQDSTVYMVAKCIDSRGDNQAALTRSDSRTGDGWYGIRATTSGWRYRSGTTLSTNDFVVVALKYTNGSLTEYINTLTPNTTSIGTMDDYVGIGISTTTNSASYGNSTTLEVKYIGAVSEAESDSVVQQNINNLIALYLGGVLKITKPINGYTYTITPNFGQAYTISCSIYGQFSKTSHQYTVSNKTIKIELTGQNSSIQTIYGAIYVDNVKVYDISTGTTSGGNGSYPVDYTSSYFDIS